MANTHAKLPECAAVQATLVEQMERITENQRKISDKVFGNGRVGLDQQTDTNTRDIAEIIAAIKKMNEARELETKAREQEIKERKVDTRKWWLTQASGLITTILAVAQTVVIAIVLTK
jgi:hypothetical protein